MSWGRCMMGHLLIGDGCWRPRFVYFAESCWFGAANKRSHLITGPSPIFSTPPPRAMGTRLMGTGSTRAHT
jgi:hypothetical protein